MNVLICIVIGLDEGAGTIFVYELYLCTYKMEVREQKLLTLAKNALGITLVSIVVVG